jgi:hypothetical protein
MQNLTRLILAILVAAPAGALAEVKVNFVNPEKYTDASMPGGRDRERNLGEIEKAFQNLGERYLSRGQTLTIDVLDVDLAGRVFPGRLYRNDIRVVYDITWPRMKLRYALESESQAPLRGEETLSDPSFMMFPFAIYTNRPLLYERQMMERWFVSRIVKQNPPR